jgi:hypothetical protein
MLANISIVEFKEETVVGTHIEVIMKENYKCKELWVNFGDILRKQKPFPHSYGVSVVHSSNLDDPFTYWATFPICKDGAIWKSWYFLQENMFS